MFQGRNRSVERKPGPGFLAWGFLSLRLKGANWWLRFWCSGLAFVTDNRELHTVGLPVHVASKGA